GSTGQPKGALVHHAGALNHIDAEFDVLDFIDENHQLMAKNFLQSAASSSDVSVWQFLAPLMCGGQTVILDDMTDIPKLVRLLQQHQVHLMQAAPVVLQLLVD
ncbi:AMP-binding protein, partial [Vibrio azureus]